MLRKKIKELIPSFISNLFSKFFSFKNVSLFDGDDFLFKELTKEIKIYGEYGCGLSSTWMLKNTSSKVISVDSSKEWVKKVKAENKEAHSRLIISHIDLGEIGNYGRPLSYKNCNEFSNYTNYIWKQSETPSLVLIDGRFRVCCFLTSLKFADAGTKIIFDDYVNRPHYHFIEKYVPRIKECGRQCLFIIPSKNKINMNSLNNDIEAFRFVMD